MFTWALLVTCSCRYLRVGPHCGHCGISDSRNIASTALENSGDWIDSWQMNVLWPIKRQGKGITRYSVFAPTHGLSALNIRLYSWLQGKPNFPYPSSHLLQLPFISLTALLTYNLHAIKFTHFNCTIQWLSKFTDLCNHHCHTALEHSQYPKKFSTLGPATINLLSL